MRLSGFCERLREIFPRVLKIKLIWTTISKWCAVPVPLFFPSFPSSLHQLLLLRLLLLFFYLSKIQKTFHILIVNYLKQSKRMKCQNVTLSRYLILSLCICGWLKTVDIFQRWHAQIFSQYINFIYTRDFPLEFTTHEHKGVFPT